MPVAIIDRQSIVVHSIKHINHFVSRDLTIAVVVKDAHQQLHFLRA
jgi:hypothetical protein